MYSGWETKKYIQAYFNRTTFRNLKKKIVKSNDTKKSHCAYKTIAYSLHVPF